jgi:ABC-type nitrate/sulfonate/bicarbonate transport system substrate-binding protein
VAIVAIARVVAVVVVVVGPPPLRGVGTRIDHLLSAQADAHEDTESEYGQALRQGGVRVDLASRQHSTGAFQ